jgi:hypothetical protein
MPEAALQIAEPAEVGTYSWNGKTTAARTKLAGNLALLKLLINDAYKNHHVRLATPPIINYSPSENSQHHPASS